MDNREIDALIQKHIFGDDVFQHPYITSVFVGNDGTEETDALAYIETREWTDKNGQTGMIKQPAMVPQYTADWNAMRLVVEEMAKRETFFMITTPLKGLQDKYSVGCCDKGALYLAEVEADTLPLAVCLAALKALGIDPETKGQANG